MIFDLPWVTHRWILQLITGSNLKCILYARFLNFINSIHNSSKPALRYLYSISASDVRSVTGSNLRSILVNTGLQAIPGTLQSEAIKKHILHDVPIGEEWKIPLIHSLLEVQAGATQILFDEDDCGGTETLARDILHNICVT